MGEKYADPKVNDLSLAEQVCEKIGIDLLPEETLLSWMEDELTDTEYQYMKSHYFDGKTLTEVAREFGKTCENVRAACVRGATKLRWREQGKRYKKKRIRHSFA